jgi:hypothetical protein
MPLIPRPTWEPLPDPEGPDPATATEFQALADEHLGGLESWDDQASSSLGQMGSDQAAGEAELDAFGIERISSAEQLKNMQDEADKDTLEDEIREAAEQDAEMDSLFDELGEALT